MILSALSLPSGQLTETLPLAPAAIGVLLLTWMIAPSSEARTELACSSLEPTESGARSLAVRDWSATSEEVTEAGPRSAPQVVAGPRHVPVVRLPDEWGVARPGVSVSKVCGRFS